jgi:hypothetical protein
VKSLLSENREPSSLRISRIRRIKILRRKPICCTKFSWKRVSLDKKKMKKLRIRKVKRRESKMPSPLEIFSKCLEYWLRLKTNSNKAKRVTQKKKNFSRSRMMLMLEQFKRPDLITTCNIL